jgi:ERF superfamily
MEENKENMFAVKWSERSETITKIAPALCKFQAGMQPIMKDSNNPFFRSKYADLPSIWDAIRKPLTDNGLCILQEPSTNGIKLVMTTTLIHVSGEYFRSSMEYPVDKQTAQGYGSATTYARRYGLQSVTGVAPEDDDGNAASGRGNSQASKPPIEPAIPVVQADKENRKQKLTREAIAAKKAYQYDPQGMGKQYPSPEEKAAAWKRAIRDYGAISENGSIYTLSPVEDWYSFWLNEYELDNLPESFGNKEAQQ